MNPPSASLPRRSRDPGRLQLLVVQNLQLVNPQATFPSIRILERFVVVFPVSKATPGFWGASEFWEMQLKHPLLIVQTRLGRGLDPPWTRLCSRRPTQRPKRQVEIANCRGSSRLSLPWTEENWQEQRRSQIPLGSFQRTLGVPEPDPAPGTLLLRSRFLRRRS